MVVGLDTGSDRWHAIKRFADGMPVPEQFKIKDSNPDVRRIELYRSARIFFGGLAEQAAPVNVFCEEPLALANGKTTRILGLACGAIWAAHLDFDITWWWVNVSTWKKGVCGLPANAKKDEVQLWSVLKGGGQEAWDEDHHDANAISVHGERILAQIATQA